MTLIEMLNIVEGYDLSAMAFNGEEYVDLLARTMQWAYRDRANHLADPEHAAVPVERLTSKAYAEEARRAIDRGEMFTVPRWRAHETGTTHLSVVDQWGNAVALTHSLGAASGVVTDGLGFQYNNCMNCFNPVPGHVNSIAPGKARASGITPTIILKDDKALQPAQNIAPVARKDLVDAAPADFAQTLNAVSVKLTTDELTKLNVEVSVNQKSFAAAAKQWLTDQGLI